MPRAAFSNTTNFKAVQYLLMVCSRRHRNYSKKLRATGPKFQYDLQNYMSCFFINEIGSGGEKLLVKEVETFSIVLYRELG